MRPTVVIAEQSALIARQIAAAFEHVGYRVVAVCHDGMSALDSIKDHKPTVATMDILLPGLGGLQLAGAVRRSMLDTKVFFVTAVSSRDRVEAARMLGAAFYALKPIDLERLANAAKSAATQELSHASAV